MPEGDTIFRAAHDAAPVHGRPSRHPVRVGLSGADAHRRGPSGRRPDHRIGVRAGKHLLITFSGDLVLRTHMRMNGSWHIYPAGARWQRPARDMRVLVGTADACAVGFNVPDRGAALGPRSRAAPQLQALGPDLLAEPFDRDEAIRRIRARGDDADRRRAAQSARRRRHRQRVQVGDPVPRRRSTRSRRSRR